MRFGDGKPVNDDNSIQYQSGATIFLHSDGQAILLSVGNTGSAIRRVSASRRSNTRDTSFFKEVFENALLCLGTHDFLRQSVCF